MRNREPSADSDRQDDEAAAQAAVPRAARPRPRSGPRDPARAEGGSRGARIGGLPLRGSCVHAVRAADLRTAR